MAKTAAGNVDLKQHFDRGSIQIPSTPPECVIIIDTREQKPYRFKIPTIQKGLHTGDYSVRNFEDDMTVERKSLPDLVKCVGRDRDRFMDQMNRLKAYRNRMLMIECSWQEIEEGGWRARSVHPNMVLGTLCSIASMGVPFVVAGDRKRAAALTERFLVGCHKREWAYMRRRLLDRS
jgi:ERCC4-type nuclease